MPPRLLRSVNTPTKTQGVGAGKAADLTYWEGAARVIASCSTSSKIIVEKSTVPVKTADAIEKVRGAAGGGEQPPAAQRMRGMPSSVQQVQLPSPPACLAPVQVLRRNCKHKNVQFEILSNPEFLAEGAKGHVR